MRKTFFILALNLFVLSLAFSQTYKPYVLAGSVDNSDIKSIQSAVVDQLKANGFVLLGSYNPMQKGTRILIAVSHPSLQKAVETTGGLTGFASVLRVALTQSGSKIDISYTNPHYWAAAYFQKQYTTISTSIDEVAQAFASAFSAYGPSSEFGSKKGVSLKELQKYHYMLGMPYFEDNVVLGKFASFSEAVSHIDNQFAQKVPNLIKVYEKSIPAKKIKLYGVGLAGDKGEATFMPTIDISEPKHTAFLPYEVLVYDNQVYMLHGRFRIALSFPDLTMGTFMKIVSTPGNIEEMLKTLCE